MNKATLTKQINKVKAEIAIIQRVIETTPAGQTPYYLGDYAPARLYIEQRELTVLTEKRNKIIAANPKTKEEKKFSIYRELNEYF